MSVPLDRLYNFLHDVCNHHNLIIYRFFPHGSKKIEDLTMLLPETVKKSDVKLFAAKNIKVVFFHDQEPLDFDLYSIPNSTDTLLKIKDRTDPSITSNLIEKNREMLDQHLPELNLKMVTASGLWLRPALLVHSEKRSPQLTRYESSGFYKSENFISVYWWCHAAIARDWFRYAEHDTVLHEQKSITHDFLIYNRAWIGTREYRLKFAELLIENNLINSSMTWFNPVDTDQHYQTYKFKNSKFQVRRFDLHQYLPATVADSSYSADYCASDYRRTNAEIVLETLFDDDRLHLTEKTLRPIACGQPFILAATVGSLEYLRSYGFETFNGLIDESYDTVQDPVERLQAICTEMKRISELSTTQKEQLFKELSKIARRNQKKFFSKQWHQSIVDEFKQNFEVACVRFDQVINYPV